MALEIPVVKPAAELSDWNRAQQLAAEKKRAKAKLEAFLMDARERLPGFAEAEADAEAAEKALEAFLKPVKLEAVAQLPALALEGKPVAPKLVKARGISFKVAAVAPAYRLSADI